MVSKGRKQDSLRRRAPTRAPKRRILIVCEGEKTERLYFQAFQHDVHNPRVHVEVAKETGVPLTVVEHAVRLRREAEREAVQLRDENIRWDDVWAVFDVDEHPHIAEACALAVAESVDVAISNPCFELWALLHFQDQRAHITRQQARAQLKGFLDDYEKALDYARMRGAYSSAVGKARDLDVAAARDKRPGANPTTGVYRLTELIRTSC